MILLSILNLISTLCSLIFQILLVRVFGAHLETDIYYLAITIIQFISIVFSGFIMDLYIPVYNEIKVKNEKKASELVGGLILLMSIISVILFFLLIVFSSYIVKAFATGFNSEKIKFASKIISTLAVTIIFTFLREIINATLQANLFIYITYLTPSIVPLMNTLFLLGFASKYGIMGIIYATVLSSFLSFLVSFLYLRKKIDIKFTNPFKNPNIFYLFKQNLPIRAGNIIYQFIGPLTTNVLSYLPTGYITLYNYSNRILNILFQIINLPITQVLYIKSTDFLYTKNIEKLKNILLLTLRSTTIFFIIIIVPIIILFEKIFTILLGSKITSKEIVIINYLFLSLIPFFITISFETPFTKITMAMKRGIKIFQINILFIIIYTFFLLLFKFLNIYAIPAALFLAQITNTLTYIRTVNRDLHLIDFEFIKMVIKFSLFIVFLIIINLIFHNNFIYKLFLTSFLFFLWSLIIAKEDIILAINFIRKKGGIR